MHMIESGSDMQENRWVDMQLEIHLRYMHEFLPNVKHAHDNRVHRIEELVKPQSKE